MKIVIAADIFPPDIGGPATYSKKLSQEIKKNGHSVQVVCYGDKSVVTCDPAVETHCHCVNDSSSLRGGTTKQSYDFKITKIGRDKSMLVRYFEYFHNLLKAGKNADLIYAMGPVSAGLPTMVASKILRKKYIVKVVGDYAWEQGRNRFGVRDSIDNFQNKKYSFVIEVFRFIQKIVVKNAYKVITPSFYLQNIVTGWGVDKKNIEVIYNSVDFKNIKEEKRETKTVLSIGRLVGWKGFEALIDIWPEILKKDSALKLVIIGDGPERKKLEKSIIDKKLEKNIYLMGRVDHEELPNFFNSSSIFALNSGYEGLSHVIIEAMAHRLPVIASDIGGNRELIENGKNGILVKYNDKKEWKKAILKLYDNNELKNKFVDNSFKGFDKFDYSMMIDKTLNFLKNNI